MALASFAGGCSQLPDDDNNSNRAPTGRRDAGEDDSVVAVKDDPCSKRSAAGKTQKQAAGDRPSKVLFNNDFEKPNVPLKADCGGGRLDQGHGINALYGTPDFQFAQGFTVEGVVLQDEQGTYIDESGRGGRYAIGMLSDIQDDKLSLSFANDMPVVNVRLDVSGIAIKDCGANPAITTPKLRVSLYDGELGKNELESKSGPGEPLDTALVTGNDVRDAWTFKWRTAIVGLDASGATSDKVSVVFDLEEGGYAALDNLSIVASTKKGVVDADTNGVPDDVQCTGENAAGGGMGGVGDDPAAARDAGTAARDAGAPVDAGAPAPATPPPAMPATPPAAPPTTTAPPPPAATRDAGTSRSSDDDDDDREDDDDDDDDSRSNNPFGGIIDAIRDAGLGRSRGR